MSAGWHRGDWMQTFTGRQFYPLAPRADDVDIVDIAHSLAMQCRYNGHTQRFYSVAEHCVLMSDWFLDDSGVLGDEEARNLALWALLHDATEAYVGDMVRPLKRSMPSFCAAEDVIMRVIAEKYGLRGGEPVVIAHTGDDPVSFDNGLTMPARVKEIDTRILLDERSALLAEPPRPWSIPDDGPLSVPIHAWDPETAEREYLQRFTGLTGTEVTA